ncbi:nucleotidyltransferase domain-containing protein [bacterium]|nr:nucleotidyltransferase domain-containing protein [bacterium]
MEYGISAKSYNYMMSVMHAQQAVEKVVLFGSRAMGNARKGSDIDLALFGKKLTLNDARTVSILMNEKGPVPYCVDVLIYHEIKNKALRKHIDDEGQVIFKRCH